MLGTSTTSWGTGDIGGFVGDDARKVGVQISRVVCELEKLELNSIHKEDPFQGFWAGEKYDHLSNSNYNNNNDDVSSLL